MNASNRTMLAGCPACCRPLDDGTLLFTVSEDYKAVAVRRCRCGLTYKASVPSPEALKAIYSGSYVHFDSHASSQELASINSAEVRLNRCRPLLPRKEIGPLRILDYGCGSGAFVSILRSFGHLAEGVDPFLPRANRSAHLHDDPADQRLLGAFDIVTLLNVAEHMVDPRAVFSRLRTYLKPHGCLVITCPFGDSLARRLYKGEWTQLALPEHLLFWTPSSLTRMLRELGFGGPVRARVLGSPFPLGKVRHAPPPVKDATARNNSETRNARPSPAPIAYKLARELQHRKGVSSLARHLLSATRLGDYLEYVIRAER